MRILIFLLALTSAFFVSADEPDMTDLVPPKLVPNGAGTCTRGDPDVSLDECKAVADGTDQKFKDNPAFILNSESFTSVNSDGYTSVTWSFSCENCGFGGSPKTFASYASYVYNRTSETCPPDEFPEHNISVTGDNDSIMCAKPYVPEDCPAGYHSKAVSAQIGGTECVPKECPPAGSGENLSSSPATGGVPFSGGGMYCNDGCAYSVPASNITSQGYASGTSQGVSCGDKPYDNKKLADEGNEGGCKTTTDSSGVSVMTCDTPADQPEAEDTDVDNEENKTDDTPNTKKPLEDCAIDDTACLLRNLQTSSENNNQDVIDNDNLLHNKLIDAITNNTNVIKNSVENLDTTVYLAQQENSKNDTIKIQKLDGIIDAIKGIEISGGGGGGGGGTGSGSDGEDCEGSVSDCVPIEGFEIPSQTVDLQQYADKYDDWLPNAELPEEKCIVLTTGKSVCLSFEAFILLFKAISGLLVIGALMHSAKIISGAI